MADDENPIGNRPLYLQVRERLVLRLADRRWPPGTMIPSEIELARELGVSQGTVRKALNEMTADNLLVRRQGRGTFVVEPEDSRILFQFFRLAPDDGPPSFPLSRFLAMRPAAATAGEAAAIGLGRGDPVWRLTRTRSLEGRRVLHETITLSRARFTDLPPVEELPNNLYQLYSARFGVTIAQAEERLKAVPAAAEVAAALGCPAGAPLLRIRRIARDLAGDPVELRVSCCLTADIHYGVNLR